MDSDQSDMNQELSEDDEIKICQHVWVLLKAYTDTCRLRFKLLIVFIILLKEVENLLNILLYYIFVLLVSQKLAVGEHSLLASCHTKVGGINAHSEFLQTVIINLKK